LFVFIAALLLLAATSSAWASDAPALPKGWQAHHPIHIRGGVHKGMHPDTSSGDAGYTPAQIRHAYGIDQFSNTGAGQTIAIIVAYGSPTICADLTAFDNEYGLPLPTPTNLIIHSMGSSDSNPSNSDLEGWAQETSLDVEWAHALAPDSNILLVEASSDNGGDLFSAVQYANTQNPRIVSMSWGGSEFSYSSESSCDTTYFSNSGTVYLAASGDNGTLNYPASSPNVIAVGGTSLPLDAGGNLAGSETAWSDSYGSSGGGISRYEAQPSWQTSFGISFSSSKRCAPDVAFDADPNTGVNTYFDASPFGGSAGWWLAGGTSLATPCWAAIIALADQNSRITNASQALYRLAGSQSNFNPDGAYRDITSGSNGAHSAVVGYDLVTGLGSPIANVLIPGLLSPVGWINTPAAGKTVSGTITVSGWYLDGSGVSSVQVLVDGTVNGTAAYGDARPDVEAAYPAYSNANSGFHYNLNTTSLSNGSHIIAVKETGDNGGTSSMQVTVTV
jgi:subtilase family serine protease